MKVAAYLHHENGTRGLSRGSDVRYAKFFAVNLEWLLTGTGPMKRSQQAEPEQPLPQIVEALPGPAMPSVNALPIDVPVLGTGVGGSAGDFSLNGQIIDYVRRPPGMVRTRNIFCIFLSGDSMFPRLEHGDMLYINPNRPARPGEDVLVEMHPSRPAEPGAAYVKQLEAKTPTKLILKQFNPPGKLELPLAKILRISPIMRNKELMGV